MKKGKTVENLVYNGDKGQEIPPFGNKYDHYYNNHVDSRVIGRLGEDIAARWLLAHGYTIIDRNYLLSFGEIDIIAKRHGCTHYVEVKTIRVVSGVSRGQYDPWQNISRLKVKTIIATAHYHRRQFRIAGPYQIDGLVIILDIKKRTATVQMLENINI